MSAPEEYIYIYYISICVIYYYQYIYIYTYTCIIYINPLAAIPWKKVGPCPALYIYICIHIYICVNEYRHSYVCISVCLYLDVNLNVHVHVYLHVYVYPTACGKERLRASYLPLIMIPPPGASTKTRWVRFLARKSGYTVGKRNIKHQKLVYLIVREDSMVTFWHWEHSD